MTTTTDFVLTEYLGHDWTAHAVSFPHPLAEKLPVGTAVAVRDLTYNLLLTGQIGPGGKVHFITDLWSDEERRFGLDPDAAVPASDISVREDAGTYVLGSSGVTIGVPRTEAVGPGGAPAPLSWIMGPEGVRRGRGYWDACLPLTSVRSWVSAQGPVFAEASVEYRFNNGRHYRITWRVFSRAPVAVAEEHKDVRDGGSWSFSLYDNFAPDRAHLGFGDNPKWTPDYQTGEHICRHIFFNHYSQYQDFKDISYLFRSKGNRDADVVGIFPVNGNAWTDLTANIISLDTTPAPDIRYSFSLSPGFRSFAFFALRDRETRVRRRSDFTYGPYIVGNTATGVYAIAAKWSTVRLDDVKEMALDWPRGPQAYPFLYATPDRLREAIAKMTAEPATYGDMPKLHPLFSGHPQTVDSLRKEFFYHLERMRDDAVEFGPNGCNANPVMFRPLVECPFYYETLCVHRALSPEEDRKARAIMAFLAYFTDREDYYFGRRSLLPEGHPDYIMSLFKGMRSENFGTDRFIGVGMVGAIFPDHPNSARWKALARELFEMQMDVLVGKCGAWCEGWNYYLWALQLLMNYALAMRSAGDDLFAHPKFKAMIRFVMESLSPPNPIYGNRRINPGYGSYGDNPDGCGFGHLMAQAAWVYASSDPQLSAELMWAYHETSAEPFPSFHAPSRDAEKAMIVLNTDFSLPARKPARTSRGCPDFGALFHHTHEDGRETYLIARASPYWPHGHADAGSFFMYYKNAPLITEAARGMNAGNPLVKSNGDAHNIIRFDGKEPMQYVWPNRQNLVKFTSAPGIECAVLDCRQERLIVSDKKRRGHGDAETVDVNIRHYRHIVYLKPDVFVIYDAILNAPFASDYRLHCYAAGVRFEGNHALFTGRRGIDLDMAVVLPEKPVFSTREIIDTHSVDFANGPNQPYLVVLSPREAGTRPPVDCRLAGDVLTVGVDDASWRVRLAATPETGIYDFVLG